MEINDKNLGQKAFLESKVENFELNIYDPRNDLIVNKKISDFEGKWLVLVFYPADFTFVCPTELKDLGRVYDSIRECNSELLVVSTDTVFSHKRWVETEILLKEFKISMVSDRLGEITKYFGIFNQETGNSERGSFIISPDGVLKSIEIVTEPIGRSSAELLRKVQALEFVRSNPGHVCPASRNIGLKTLKPSINIAGHVGEQLQ